MPFVWFILIGLFDARMFYRIVVLCVFMIGSVDSAPPEVGSAPKFRRPVIKDRVGLLNESIQLQCKVKGNPRPYLLWLYNGEPIGINKRFQVTKYSLWIHVLSLSDVGNYSCKAWNKHGIIWGNITLRVLESTDKLYDDYYGSEEENFSDVMMKPEWPRTLEKVDYLARPATQSAVMMCETRGYPQPNITWYKDKISPYFRKEHLPVAPILDDIKNQTVVEGDNVTFTCVILMSDSQPLLQWLKHYKANNSFVNNDGEPHVHVLQQSGFKKLIDDPQYLHLTSVTKNDTGWYKCLVANSVGMNYWSAYLKVLTKTVDLTVQQVGHSSAIIQWNLTDGVSLKKFEVEYTVSDFMDKDSVEKVRVTSGNDFALVRSLDPNNEYVMKATGMTLDGDSVQSDVVHFKLIPKSRNSLVLVPGKHDVILQSIPTISGKKLDRIVHVNLANYDIIDHCIPEKELEGCDTMNFKRYVPHPKKIGKMRLVTVMTIKFLEKMQFRWALAHL